MIVVTYILFLLPSLRLFFNLSLHSFPCVIIATVPCGFAAGHPSLLPLLKEKRRAASCCPARERNYRFIIQ